MLPGLIHSEVVDEYKVEDEKTNKLQNDVTVPTHCTPASQSSGSPLV
jgi:hypothetical protein